MQKELKSDHKITFDYRLVGSAKRNLVIRHHNKNFDLDYQIFLHKNKNNYNEKKIKQTFISLFNKYKSDEFENCEDSTSAITLKRLGDNNIVISYDIVLLKIDNGCCKIIRRKNNNYYYNELPDIKNYPDKTKLIKRNMWNELRKSYCEKIIQKHNNTNYKDKKSFQIFNETINEVLKNHGITP